MEEQFTSYEIAKKMDSLQFNEECMGFFDEDNNLQIGGRFKNSSMLKGFTAPLWQQAFIWFRKKHNLDSSVIREKVKVDGKWIKSKFYIYSIENNDEFPISLGFDLKDDATYEEAEQACLEKLIEIIKDRK